MAVQAPPWRVPGYAELRELGAGAQGRVALARADGSGEVVAIKYLSDRLLSDARSMRMFRREAELLERVTNPYVARLFEYAEEPGRGAAIVMEAVNGVSLRRMLDDQDGALAPEAALAVLKGSLRGLAAAHGVGVVHRDYKPANVIVDDSGHSKLIDFGIAVLTGQGDRSGTPAYMSPEQWRGEPASAATDLYAATCVFFECVTGHRPFAAGDAATLRDQHTTAPVPLDDVPEPLRPLVARGMSKDPGHRLWDAGEFVATLEETAVSAYGPDWERRGLAVLGAAAAAFAAAFPLTMIASSAVTGIKGIIAKLTGGKAAATVAGATAIAIAAYLLWPSPPYRDAWTTDEILPDGAIRPIAGGFTFFGRTRAGTYELVTVNARTGKIRWRHPAGDPMRFAPDPGPAVVGKIVVFTQTVNEARATQRIVAVDVDTGQVRWIHGRDGLDINLTPEVCGASTVCVTVWDTTAPPRTAIQHVRALDVRTGRQLSDSPQLDAIKLAPGLYDSIDRKQVVRIGPDGRQLWRHPIKAIFGDVNPLELTVTPTRRAGRRWHTIDYNFNWSIHLKEGRYIGEIGGRGKLSTAKRLRYLDYATVAAFDAATGRRLWADPGATVFCGHLEFDLDHPVRCRKTGQVDLSSGSTPDKWRLNNVNVTVEGFDPATGRTRWSWRAGPIRGLAHDYIPNDPSVFRVDDTTYLIKAPSGPVLLDLDTGPRPVDGPLPTGWCRGQTAAAPKQTGYSWEGPLDRWRPCDAAGKEAELPATTPAFVGARSGDTYVWPGGKGLRAVIIN